ncbi:LacI family DNA-binding transcriptional regulator [Paenibacillus sp. FSL L8-0323]|uniref:LacI family DNA-binding transcriptional regulator n=1 Tax=Paenibacillus TaxID=44249 RepID=UPI002116762F|nr:LacI family DNA-binding transcriptional regulator [Paenibacillus odorifer]
MLSLDKEGESFVIEIKGSEDANVYFIVKCIRKKEESVITPTIKDVAKAANVSVCTVSRVIHNLEGYSHNTKLNVLQALEELGYYPNGVARGLINKQTRTLGVLFPSVASDFFCGILHGIEKAAYDKDYMVIVCNTGEDGKRTKNCLEMLQEKQVDGVIFTSEVLKDKYYLQLRQKKTPLVLVNAYSSKYTIPFVKVDDKLAAYQATSYLINKGHYNIAMIAGTPSDMIAGIPRVEGYRQALEEQGFIFNEARIAYGDFHMESGRVAMEKLLSEAPPFTAVFAASDEMAIGAMGKAFEKGLKIPEDLSMIGYDDLMLSKIISPPLTTVHQSLDQMGRLAVEKLLSLIEKPLELPNSTLMNHYIVERETVRTII